MISKTGMHVTLALAYLTKLPPGEYAGASFVAKQIGAPGNYLGKLFKRLTEEGLLQSQKGSGGGFRLALPADQIKLYDILEPLESLCKWDGCFMGRDRCSDEDPCAVHRRWSTIRKDYLQFLKETTLEQLAQRTATLS